MTRSASESGATADISVIRDLLAFQGNPRDFWQAWVRGSAEYLGAELAVLYVRPQSVQSAQEAWSPMVSWPTLPLEGLPPLAGSASEGLLIRAVQEGSASGPSPAGPWETALIFVLPETGDRELVLCAHVPSRTEAVTQGDLVALGMVPHFFEQSRQKKVAERDATRFSQSLETLGRVLEADSFSKAALAFVNEVCDVFACDQVALAWTSGEGLKISALSHSDRLEQKSAFTALLEEAGQEALAQETEIAWPVPQGLAGRIVSRAHQAYAEARHPGYMVSLPLLAGGEHFGALVCERKDMAFSQAELWALRLFADQVVRPLAALETRHRALWRRLAADVWSSVPGRFRPLSEEGRRFARWLAVGIGLGLLLPLPYRVETPFVVKTDAMAFIGAPFDGFIDTSNVSLGQVVKENELVFTLATRELLLERSAGLADVAQYSREVEKKRAANQLAEMRVAEAQQAQAEAKLEQVEYRLAHAQVTTPIGGIVVEGEPGKNLGGPVKRGDTILKIAKIDKLFAEIAVDERDLEQIEVGQGAEVSLVASPHHSFDMKVSRITPAPSVKDGHNTFPIRAEPMDKPPSWWRPGMSGVAKISVGYRPLIWIMSHRLLDYLALALWI